MKEEGIGLMFVSQSELEIRQWEVVFNAQDAINLIANKDVLVKFLDKCAHGYISKMALGKYKGKEWDVYAAITVIEEIKKEVDNHEQKYNQYVEAKKKEQEEKEKAEEAKKQLEVEQLGDEQSQI